MIEVDIKKTPFHRDILQWTLGYEWIVDIECVWVVVVVGGNNFLFLTKKKKLF